jgi:hypothetical protein
MHLVSIVALFRKTSRTNLFDKRPRKRSPKPLSEVATPQENPPIEIVHWNEGSYTDNQMYHFLNLPPFLQRREERRSAMYLSLLRCEKLRLLRQQRTRKILGTSC